MPLTRSFLGGSVMRWAGVEILQAVGDARNYQTAAEHLLRVANETVPLQEAILMRSGTATSGKNLGVVAYDTKYAVPQHERTDYRHDSGRRAKWLQLSLSEEKDTLMKIIGKEIGTSMSGKGL